MERKNKTVRIKSCIITNRIRWESTAEYLEVIYNLRFRVLCAGFKVKEPTFKLLLKIWHHNKQKGKKALLSTLESFIIHTLGFRPHVGFKDIEPTFITDNTQHNGVVLLNYFHLNGHTSGA